MKYSETSLLSQGVIFISHQNLVVAYNVIVSGIYNAIVSGAKARSCFLKQFVSQYQTLEVTNEIIYLPFMREFNKHHALQRVTMWFLGINMKVGFLGLVLRARKSVEPTYGHPRSFRRTLQGKELSPKTLGK